MAVRRDNLARKKVGYALRIQHEVGPKKGDWEMVGYIESHRDACIEYKNKNYASVKNFTITGVRIDLRPVSVKGVDSNEAYK